MSCAFLYYFKDVFYISKLLLDFTALDKMQEY